MMNSLNIGEVSDILLKQLEDIQPDISLSEVGSVLQVSDGVARIYGLNNAESNELLVFNNGMKAIVMNLEEDNVGAVLLYHCFILPFEPDSFPTPHSHSLPQY